MTEPRKIKSISDIDLMESLYPHCMRCHETGVALDTKELTNRFGLDVPLTVIKKMLVCEHCGQNDKIIFRLRLKSNETMPNLVEKAIR